MSPPILRLNWTASAQPSRIVLCCEAAILREAMVTVQVTALFFDFATMLGFAGISATFVAGRDSVRGPLDR